MKKEDEQKWFDLLYAESVFKSLGMPYELDIAIRARLELEGKLAPTD